MERENGFTLTELLVVMVLAGIVMAAIYSAFTSQSKAYQIQEDVSVVQQNLRVAMSYMVRELRMAGLDRNGSGNFGFKLNDDDQTANNIRVTDTNNIYFTLDRDGDAVLDENNDEQFAFRLDGTDLKKYNYSGWVTLAENIDTLIFTYLDGNETPVTPSALTIDSIRLVDITVSASQGGHTRQLSTRVCCRNLSL